MQGFNWLPVIFAEINLRYVIFRFLINDNVRLWHEEQCED